MKVGTHVQKLGLRAEKLCYKFFVEYDSDVNNAATQRLGPQSWTKEVRRWGKVTTNDPYMTHYNATNPENGQQLNR